MLQRKITPANDAVQLDPATIAMVEGAYRAGYGDGGDAAQRERRHKPFLIEDEAWSRYRVRS